MLQEKKVIRSRFARYGLAVAAVALATCVRLSLTHWMTEDADALFLAAVCVATWRGGRGPGAVAVVLSTAAQAYFIVPLSSFVLSNAQEVVGLTISTLEAAGVAALVNALETVRRRQADETHRVLFESSSVPMYAFDVASQFIVAANGAALDLYGYTREEFLALSPRALRAEEGDGDDPEIDAIAIVHHRRKDGERLEVELHSSRFMHKGRARRLLVAHDVTSREHLQAQLRQAQKMEAVGLLAGGVAHDFNNMLTIILGYTAVLVEETPKTEPLFEMVSEIHAAAERSADITKRLLAFSRQQPQIVRVVDLNGVIESTNVLLRRLVGESIEIETQLDAVPCTALVDVAQVEQVVMNLVGNARDAMPRGGRLTITTKRLDVDGTPHVAVAVRDTGTGMDDATRTRIFEPFFTTKEQGKGTGLGLAMVHGTVHQLGGRITVESTPGKGSTFTVYFPWVDCVGESGEHARPAATTGSERILLVEDEEQVRKLVYKVLVRNGYEVTSAKDPREALELCEKHGGNFDLLLTDVIMPYMSGRDLADEVLRRWPDIKVLYMSGYTDDVVLVGLDRSAELLRKPITPSVLKNIVRQVLEAA